MICRTCQRQPEKSLKADRGEETCILLGSTSGLSFHLPAFAAIKPESSQCTGARREPEVPAVSPEIAETSLLAPGPFSHSWTCLSHSPAAIPSYTSNNIVPLVPSTKGEKKKSKERKQKTTQIWIFLLISTSICPHSNQQWLQLFKKKKKQILDLIIQGSFYPLSAKADALMQPRHWIQLIAHLPFPLTSPEVICQRTHR